MKIKTYNAIYWNIIISLFFISCQNNTVIEEEAQGETTIEEWIVIEKQAFEAEHMKLETMKAQNFSKTYQTTGKIITNYQSSAMVNTSISGKINDVKVVLNQNVEKGQVLCTVESNEFIELQKNYLVALAQLKPVKSNYLRQKQLFEENISSEKAFLEAESVYEILLAEVDASRAQLENMQLSKELLNGGKIQNYFNIYAPIEGQIQQINSQIGEYVEPQNVLMHIVNGKNALLEFVIYADFASNIEVGQHLHFFTSVDRTKDYEAKVISVGQSMNSELQGVVCQASIMGEESLIPGSKVMLELFYNNINLFAIDHEAVLKAENKYYVVVLEKEDEMRYYFKKTEVKIGESNDEFTEIKTPQIKGQILTKGAYYVNLEE
ncbi:MULTISPECIES: efflux RND transporter periplasmic adaptor subunit [unclassified Lentimicrobium]|uniref:efflux RND transporter periplasmic adaptor subunit n=1 Tax=unclassified Lentimicrobium TaxID=2677434 RepID=UPI00155518C7|nr:MULTISPECIES: efflux RND transporter periplasmic adaptor subunit [unclassified Lentimicrobium]NPD46462.1 efflux RND transporter periplasmic adaptor subunit [Lentimicrobium sp. S6]NPD86605.1 efflux RND transporter periplasmic adaptor subunit [Lentimicrobium sp. L6]